ncbi:putative O-glycosylation ligase, exosortase A system-associated [Rhodoferax ferrireducens]|uniref:putative O-glycosylation ligase, exosortase A system-associated n=1 Tax=Rhodoferax ferrireducens TaxID=192843 RepID=UPI000E0DB44A|nr:putative O-glycosylation ligase, exosortase A system-associated [Rhodoferax ferrireducens]
MRDLLIIAIVMAGSLAALRQPWIGIMLWTWLSIMNPHRYAWGLAYDAPLAAVAAVSVMLGLLMTKERESPFKASPVIWLAIFMLWMTLSWLAGMDVAGDYVQWKKVMKIDLMILLALMVLQSKKHIFALMWVSVGSLALLGIKGGIFTLTTGGSHRVWGPPDSFIEGNNEIALALVVTIPLLRFLQLQLANAWARLAMTGSMVLCAAAALGSQSRGALLGISAMVLMLWWRGKNKLRMSILLVAAAVPLVAFMPDEWSARMSTINTYEEDGSAMGRINAWWVAWRIAWRYPVGVGFDPATPALFARFSPNPTDVHAAHSIYFQVLGNHGFVGLFLFLGIWFATWRMAGSMHAQKDLVPEAKWTADLGAMCQVSLVGYAVGGAFLSLAYFDLPYNILVMVVLTRIWVERQSWKTEPAYAPGWRTIPGLAKLTKPG